jgi:hypothetical protein
MGSKRSKVNRVATPADVLEKIAAINHLSVADVVRLFLAEALAERGSKLGTLKLSTASPRPFTYQGKALPARAS